ncbi:MULTISPECIES: hypothetical protein [unclassified Polaromonas]|uniref:hypothetical protein n=2 Tax=unclassified Polaromonas TaxID=2638319 RepID=UPI001596CA05|nr:MULTISPECIES: hypothetical protein [unclassified Polaromonas]
MSDPNITRLVVGPTMTLAMGVPVGQAVTQTDLSKTLRWKDGHWQNSASIIKKARQFTFLPVDVLEISATRRASTFRHLRAYALPVAAVVIFLGTALGFVLQQRDSAEDIPVATSIAPAETPVAVRSVDAPYPLPGASPSAPLPGNSQLEEESSARELAPPVPSAKGPVQVPSAPLPTVTSAKAPALPAVRPTQQAAPVVPSHKQAPAVVPKEDAKDEKARPAVILDADVPFAKAKLPEAVSQQKATAPPPALGQLPKPQASTSGSSSVSSGLVALTQDGKFALFTNVKTRLPEKFAVGDRLPTGEVLKAIDRVNGKVQTDAKEYRLE